ncbi:MULTISPECIES: DUF342 domain-containing protein [unclassified Achromobacter]|uniref:DUF342 domain-containing protein n=1 Tax=unclassified Achromobacter TaxID=2626865 RepID=UPI00117858FA|nr:MULTISPECIES: FapA family protein [unclassified Achromobacter]
MEQRYWLTLDPVTHELRAGFRAGVDAEPPSVDMLETVVATRGWTADALDGDAVARFIDRCCEVAARYAGGLAAASQGADEGAALVTELAAIESAAAHLGAVVELASAPVLADTATLDDLPDLPEGDPDVVEQVIGAVHDGSFELSIEPDHMQVFLNMQPPRGGRHVVLADVRAILADHKVVFGVKEDQLLQALEAGFCEDLVVAEGIAPSEGEPTQFKSLLDSQAPHAKVDDRALVDYRTLGNLLLVKPGMRLMRRIPAKRGKDGINVLGQAAPAPEPEDIPYDPELTGVTRDAQDPDVLVAAIAGAPSLLANGHGMSVNPVVQVEAVDLSSGNIDFDGTLQVNGDITTGMQVKVTGDVVVSGTVEAAHIDAGGNVVVKGGILGAAEGGLSGSGEPVMRSAHVIAKGSVQARFIGNATVSAGKDVVVESEIRQSDVAAGDSVTVGGKGAAQGSINGGQVRALRSVRAVTLGTMAGVKTLVQVGVNPHAAMQKEALERTRLRLTEEKGKLEQLLIFLRKHPEKGANGIGARALQTHVKLNRDLGALEAKEAELAAEKDATDGATIEVGKRIYGGVDLQIGNRREEIIEDMGGGKATLSEGKLTIR